MILSDQERKEILGCFFNGKGTVHAKTILPINSNFFHGAGRLFNHVIIPPHASIGLHSHNGDQEIYYILNGSGIYNDNGIEVRVQHGDVTICQSGEQHALKNDGDIDLEMIALVLFVSCLGGGA